MKESKFLTKDDVGPGKLVTIAKLDKQNVAFEDKAPDLKYIIYFQENIAADGSNKPLVLNWTNTQLIARAVGTEETDEWIGKKIVLFDDPNVSFKGDLVGGIRIRAPKQSQPEIDPTQDIPF